MTNLGSLMRWTSRVFKYPALLFFAMPIACAQPEGGPGPTELTIAAEPRPLDDSEQKCFVLRPVVAGPRIFDRTAMCEALERNLNEFCQGPSPSCGLKIAPGHAELSVPDWAEVDLNENMTLLENMIRGEAVASQGTRWTAAEEEWSKVLERFRDVSRESPRLEVADVDILNRGQSEPVYQFWRSTCPMPSGLSAQPEILLGRHGEIPRNPDWHASINRGESPFGGASLANGFGDVFFYDGVAFTFRWGGPLPFVQEIISSGRFVGVQTACEFEYTPKARP